MKRNLKHRIKQDELRSGLEHAWVWTRRHADEVRIGVIVLAAAGALALGLSYFQQHGRERAERAFADARAIYDTPVLADLQQGADKPSGPSFATAPEKFRKAQAAFEEVARKYGSSAVGSRARYYAALSRIELGDVAGAEKELREIAALTGDDRLVPTLARLALAEAHRSRGEIDKAIAEYRQIVEDPKAAVPRDHALMRLASALEEGGRGAEAEAAYRRLVQEFPSSVYAADARRRAEYLEPSRRG